MEGIRGLIRKIEKEERAQAGINLTEARHTAEDSSRTILVMCILAMVILLVFTYFIFADIASSNLYKKKLEESKKKTEELAKVKENFLSNMSHEIRTPLNAIVGFTDLLLKTKVEGEQKKYIDSVHTSSEHLLNVVNDILDFSKIEAGKLKVERTGFRPAELLEEVISSMRQVAQNKNISLNSILSTNLEQLILLGDPFRMKQVLLNLISNGIKFTEEGHVEVKCSASQDDVGNMLLKYDVSDTGIGIAPDKIKFIFEEFSQADTSITRQYGGTGLGLAICKKLAGLLNGSITASSTPRKGSSFSFTVLCSKGTEKDLPASRTTPSVASDRPQLERKKVLVVDDDDMNRLLLTTILRSYQMNIDEAEDGKKALALATSCAYDLILTDIHMPELSGVNMVRHIRALPDKQKATIPIIALTANIVKEDIQKYMTAGFNDYVLKPYNEAILFEKIARVLNLDPGSIDLIRKSETINVEPTSGKAYSLEELNRISNGNGPFVSKMIASFIHNTRSNITYLKDELELEHWEHIGKIAHKMGPSCYKFKLLELHGLLRDLEYKTLTEKNYSSVPSLVSHVESIANPILIALEEELKKTQTS
jgi:signal transduction histidine kinase/CheY-like chemotaxis protein